MGEQVPSSEHAVCVSLPTMSDVIGYEERDPHVMAKVQTGYPRFVIHKYIARMAEELLTESGLVDRIGFAVTSVNAAKELGEFLGTDEFSIEQREGFVF
ncbi:uncharacterized protein METZ01_LOCUS225842, partial [marine metagenome]